MSEYRIERYAPQHAPAWDALVRGARNGLFMFERPYMDYHAERFADHSLLCFKGEELAGVMPISAHGAEARSHGGLTFGGLITPPIMKTKPVFEMLELAAQYLRGQGFSSLLYKAVPHIYCPVPAEEDAYALFRLGAVIEKTEPSCAAIQAHRLSFSERRRRGVKKAQKAGLELRESEDFAAYFSMLGEVLRARHQASPTHSAQEMQLLHDRFRRQIRLWGAFDAHGAMLAGVILYLYPQVAHAQYIAASEAGRECGALDLLFSHLITDVYQHVPVFDFGISSEEGGKVLNEGLMQQKEEFGGRCIVHTAWRLAL